MTEHSITDVDIFYLSYDEPNKEQFWLDLQEKCPWAKRVDGVKGFDNAHKACAEASETPFFITVDGDNIVDLKFFNDQMVINEHLNSNTVFSFSAKNMINGLIYGNGGLKIWPKELALNMRTHENADNERAAIEFCWQINYTQLNNVYSQVWPNGSPLQAFRSGFREGVKMSLNEGLRVKPEEFTTTIFHKNLQRLRIWSTIGADVENGIWAIYGARLGCHTTNLSEEQTDVHTVRDYDWFDAYWESAIRPTFFNNGELNQDMLQSEIVRLGEELNEGIGLGLVDITPEQSAFFKSVFTNPLRTHPMITERDIERVVPPEFR